MLRRLRSWVGGLVLTLGLGLGLTPSSARADAIEWQDGARPCWDAAGARHGIDPWLLYAIASVESNYNPKIISRPNSNGTRDLGLMQINSTWLPTLRSNGVPSQAVFNACASTYIGAWIMAKNFRRYGYSWQAVAAYNVGTLNTPRRYAIGLAYAKKVYAAYGRLTRQHAATRSAWPQGLAAR